MTTDAYRDDELLRRWISGELTAPEEAELERRAARDPQLQEALDGLATTPEADHRAYVAAMLRRARPAATVRRLPYARYAAAATLLVLLAVAALLLPRYFDEAEGPIAMTEAIAAEPETTAPNPVNPAPASAPPAKGLAAAPEAESSFERIEEQQRSVPQTKEEAEPSANTAFDDVQQTAPESGAPPPPPPPAPLLQRTTLAPLAATQASTRPREVTGRVTDEDGNPIADAEVRRIGLPLGVTTDSSGTFTLPYDLTLNQLVVSHSRYGEETVEVFDTTASLQISLEQIMARTRVADFPETAVVTRVDLNDTPPARDEARPAEGYRALRRRIEADKPEGVPAGRVRVSFLVDDDGNLSDFRFRGQPDGATMDYVGKTLVETSAWEVVKASPGGRAPDRSRPVRVYFTLRFE